MKYRDKENEKKIRKINEQEIHVINKHGVVLQWNPS